MAKKATSTSGSSRLTRSETVTVRLDPKLRYLAELAARKQRRSLSSYIEWALEVSLNQVMIYEGTNYNNDDSISVQDESKRLWDVDEADRFCKLAMSYPDLLTHDQQRVWKLIKELEFAIIGEKDEKSWGLMLEGEPIYPAIRIVWDSLWDFINEEIEYSDLTQIIQHTTPPLSHWIKKQPAKPSIPYGDDDVPF